MALEKLTWIVVGLYVRTYVKARLLVFSATIKWCSIRHDESIEMVIIKI